MSPEQLFPAGTTSAEDTEIYKSIKPLIKFLRDAPRADRDHVISVAKTLAKSLKKHGKPGQK